MLVFVNSKSGDNQVRNCFYTGPCYKISTSFRTSCCLMYILMTFRNLHWLQAGCSCRESYTVYCCTGIFPHQGLLLLLQIISYFCGLKCNISPSLFMSIFNTDVPFLRKLIYSVNTNVAVFRWWQIHLTSNKKLTKSFWKNNALPIDLNHIHVYLLILIILFFFLGCKVY